MKRPHTCFLLMIFAMSGCGVSRGGGSRFNPDAAFHFADHLNEARIIDSRVPDDRVRPVTWRFDRDQPDWQTAEHDRFVPLKTEQLEDALKVELAGLDHPWASHAGLILVDLPSWRLADWGEILLRVRTASHQLRSLQLGLNHGAGIRPSDGGVVPYENLSSGLWPIPDGEVHSYRLPVRATWPGWRDPWDELVLVFYAKEPATVEVVSVTAIPKAEEFSASAVGVRTVDLGGRYRRALYAHAPGAVEFPVRIPKNGRLDFSLGIIGADRPVTFLVTATVGGERTEVFAETQGTSDRWMPRTVDLTEFGGDQAVLGFVSSSEVKGRVALWGSPTLGSSSGSKKPNVILYVIDGAGADWMSLYGYNRRTTPNLENLAAEGVVFERAYSNATWTKLSNPSFLTSLYPSALGFFRSLSDRLPSGVPTLSDYFRTAGYLTAYLTSNPTGATATGLEHGPDLVWVAETPVNSTSSAVLHREFWAWRNETPPGPYLVHLQTTDVHEPFDSQPPFAGLFLEPMDREEYLSWDRRLSEFGGWTNLGAYSKIGSTKTRFAHAQQALYDECMAHQDHQLGRLVDRLKARGEWGNTILIVTADHGYPAGSHRLMEPMQIGAPYFHPFATRIPLLVVWPNRVQAGVRLTEPVSLVDVVPTLLDLAGLPPPELSQGRSLAGPILAGIEPSKRPVFIDMPSTDFERDETIGTIEIVDGRWGASLVITSTAPGAVPHKRARHGDGLKGHFDRAERLLVYDLVDDPYCMKPINSERPDLVDKYRSILESKWKENTDLRDRLGAVGETDYDPRLLDRLRTLGYVE